MADRSLRAEGAVCPTAACTRTAHHVGVAGNDGIDERQELARVIAVVAIEEDDDVRWVRGEMGKGSQARSAVAALGLVDDLGAVFSGYFGGAIGGTVVSDDDAADGRAGDFV